MEFRRFDGCCGATELRGIVPNVKAIKKSLSEIAAGVRARNSHRAGGSHLVVATINERQVDELFALESAGFERIWQFENGITGRDVIVMVAEIKISRK